MFKDAKYIPWMLVDIAFPVAAYYGIYHGIVPLANLVLFMAWVLAVLALLISFTVRDDPAVLERVKSRPLWRRAPAWVVDALMIGLMASGGWFVIAAFYTLGHGFYYGAIYYTPKEATNGVGQ